MRERCFIQYLVKASAERRYTNFTYTVNTRLSSPGETVADTKILVFSLLRSFIVTPFDLAIVNRKQRSFFVFLLFFLKKKKMHSKKIIKLDSKQQTLFGLLGQQFRPTRTTKSETADDGDLDNKNSQSQTEPTKQQTKKVSALYQGLVKTDNMYHRYLIICH